jgi:hypothetical protein
LGGRKGSREAVVRNETRKIRGCLRLIREAFLEMVNLDGRIEKSQLC